MYTTIVINFWHFGLIIPMAAEVMRLTFYSKNRRGATDRTNSRKVAEGWRKSSQRNRLSFGFPLLVQFKACSLPSLPSKRNLFLKKSVPKAIAKKCKFATLPCSDRESEFQLALKSKIMRRFPINDTSPIPARRNYRYAQQRGLLFIGMGSWHSIIAQMKLGNGFWSDLIIGLLVCIENGWSERKSNF